MSGLHAAMVVLALTGAEPEQPILLNFSATWCLPCRRMDPVVDSLIAKGYRVRKLDLDRDGETARRLGVTQVPCFVMLAGGRETGRVLGVVPADTLEQMFAEAQRQVSAIPLAVPNRLPDQPMPVPQPIPLPTSVATEALAMESSRKSPSATLASWENASGIPLQPASRLAPAAPQASQRVPDRELIAATVRLRVHDDRGPSIGTGTIIDARGGKALILTCGHIFRDYREGGQIEVDLFGSASPQTVAGKLLSFDDKRDVGLLMIQAPGPVQVLKVAPSGYSVEVGEAVINVGCNHGDPPSIRRNKVTARDRYLGPPNIQVAGLPVQGRSGGGLFSEEGFVIGVCNAADPEDNEGLYAALPSIHRQLEEAGLSIVFEEQSLASAVAQAPMIKVEPPSMPKSKPTPDAMMLETDSRDSSGATIRTGVASPLTPEEQRLLDELRRRKADGAEIICIVRAKNDPEARSEVFVFENASQNLVERLTAEGFARR